MDMEDVNEKIREVKRKVEDMMRLKQLDKQLGDVKKKVPLHHY
jgi:DNA polymerase elongation subunit (family B)